MIEIIEKEPYHDYSAFIGDCDMYPTFMVKDGKEYFMWNRRVPDDSWVDREREGQKKFLIENDGKYFFFYAHYSDPFEMLSMIARRKFSFTEPEEKNFNSIGMQSSGILDFHGNLDEVSAAFFYRIYDQEMAAKVKEAVRHIHRKEWDKVCFTQE